MDSGGYFFVQISSIVREKREICVACVNSEGKKNVSFYTEIKPILSINKLRQFIFTEEKAWAEPNA